MRLRSPAEILGLPKRSVLLSCGRFDTCRRSTLSCWRRTRISATSFVLGLKNEAMMRRISRSNSIIKWQGYRVSPSRLAESNFRHTHPCSPVFLEWEDADWHDQTPHRPKADAGRNMGSIEQAVALKLIQRLVRLNLSMRPLPVWRIETLGRIGHINWRQKS